MEKAVIYRGAQAPVLQAYVPLSIFCLECLLFVLCMRFASLWALLLLPLHVVLVLKTSENPFWPRDLVADYLHRWFVSNKDTHGRGTVSFCPHGSREPASRRGRD